MIDRSPACFPGWGPAQLRIRPEKSPFRLLGSMWEHRATAQNRSRPTRPRRLPAITVQRFVLTIPIDPWLRSNIALRSRHAIRGFSEGGICAAICSGARASLATESFVGLDRELVTGETHRVGNHIPRVELRMRDSCEHQRDIRTNPLAMQFRDGPINLGGKGRPLRTVHFSRVLPITLAKRTPEIGKVFTDLSPVASNTSYDGGARGRREFPQRLGKSLTNTLTWSMTILSLRGTSPAGLHLRRQFRKS